MARAVGHGANGVKLDIGESDRLGDVRPCTADAAPLFQPHVIQLQNLELRYEPFPIGVVRPALDDALYARLVDHFPSIEQFQDYAYMGKRGTKLTLSEKEDPRGFARFLRSDPIWAEFHRYLKSDAFIYGVLDTLAARHVDLGLRPMSTARRAWKTARGALRGRRPSLPPRLASRAEFSALPAAGGNLPPHTDAPTKVVTAVLSIVRPGEWNPLLGGGTDVNRPKSTRHAFNQQNEMADFEDMEVVDSYEFLPNQLVLFVKTYDSWHSVRPIRGTESDPYRKTLTINIERV